MAESEARASSSVDPKEKTSRIETEEDIGKEFLSSWKSMSITEDQAMDFDFETVAQGKKKAFNFGKLDMDFHLGGEFEKMSSFKVDMEDLDFSSPIKKIAKPKERSEEEDSTSGKRQGKQKHFDFSFDFNELDNFDFGPSFPDGDKKSEKCPDSQKTTNDRIDCQGSRIDLPECVGAIDDRPTTAVPPSESLAASKAETLVSSPKYHDLPSDNPPEKSANFGNSVVPQSSRTSFEKTLMEAEKTAQQSQPSLKKISSDPFDQNTTISMPVLSVSGKNPTQDTVSELQTEVSPQKTRVNFGSLVERSFDSRTVADLGNKNERSKLNNSCPSHMWEPQCNDKESRKPDCNNRAPMKSIDGVEQAQGDTALEDTSTVTASLPSKESRKILLVPLNSGAIEENLTTTKEKDSGVIGSRLSEKLGESESQLLQTLSTQTKNAFSDSKITFTMNSSLADQRRDSSNVDDAQTGSKMAGNSSSRSGGLRRDKTTLTGSSKNSINPENISLDARSGSEGKEVLIPKSFQGNPSRSIEPITKSSSKNCVIPKLLVPSMASMRKIVSVDKNKLSSLKAARRVADLSGLNSVCDDKSVEYKNGLSNSTSQKESSRSRNSDLDVELHESTASKMDRYVRTEKQVPIFSSLKRKTYEAPNADLMVLNPLKRLSQSPTESESRIKEASETVFQQQVCNHEVQVNSNINHSFSYPSSTMDVTGEVNMAELKISSVLDYDGNVERAEAYAKELDDICNMLKKKHDEAKELLVWAIVNNNNMLMLNHPSYDEKIHKVQKIAARLMSKEVQT